MKKKIVFLTGTRADYGKIKPLMRVLQDSRQYELYVYVTGMHLSRIHGSTYHEVLADAWTNIQIDYPSMNQMGSMAFNLSGILKNFSGYLNLVKPDLVVVHGDRIRAMAGALATSLCNIRLAHIEGGEVTGTIDESLRHAITKLAHEHFVANEEAAQRVRSLGEKRESVHVIGSPDIDAMVGDLPSLEDAKKRYEIPFQEFGIVMFHPVTTNTEGLLEQTRALFQALDDSGENFVVIYPNNDLGHDVILSVYNRYRKNRRFRFFPSIRFEFFLALLKNAKVLIGNSSAGIREAGVYGTPAINIGLRQDGRFDKEHLPEHLMHLDGFQRTRILHALQIMQKKPLSSQFHWGDGFARHHFMKVLNRPEFWTRSVQKRLPF